MQIFRKTDKQSPRHFKTERRTNGQRRVGPHRKNPGPKMWKTKEELAP